MAPEMAVDSESLENARGGRRARARDSAWLVAMVVVAGIAAYPGLLIAPNHWDSCLFVWQGKRMLAGDLPYLTVWDQKFPVLLWINALAAATGHAYAALYGIQSIAIGASAWLISLMARRRVSPAAGVAAGFAYATFASTLTMGGTGNLPETYAAPFAILCLYAMVRYAEGERPPWLWPLVSGVGLGIATLLRPPAAIIGAALLPLVPAMRRSRVLHWRTVVTWMGGCLVVPLATAAWAASKGILGLMIRDCILDNVAYAVGIGVPESASWAHVGRTLQNITIETWVWHLAGLVGLFIVLLSANDAKAERNGERPTDLRGMAVAWLIAAFFSALPSLQFYVHYYYLTLAPLAFLSAWAWQELVLRFWDGRWRQRAGAWGLAIVTLLVISVQVQWDYADANERRIKAHPVVEMEQFLATHGRPTDTLAVFGWGTEMDLLARLGWPSPTKHPHAIIYPGLPGGGQRLGEWSEEMVRQPPVWLVCNDRQDLVRGNIISSFAWTDRERQIAQPVVDEFQSRFDEVARFPVRNRRSMGEPASYVIYRDRRASPTP